MTLLIPTIPNSELVALGWIRDVVNAYDIAVGTTLQGPDPDTLILPWGDTGFVQCSVVGGNINGTVPIRSPVMSVDCYAVNQQSKSRPPWGRANSIAEMIVAASRVFTWGATQRAVTLPTTFGKVLVREGSVVNEPERRPADEASYARYGFELKMSWLPL